MHHKHWVRPLPSNSWRPHVSLSSGPHRDEATQQHALTLIKFTFIKFLRDFLWPSEPELLPSRLISFSTLRRLDSLTAGLTSPSEGNLTSPEQIHWVYVWGSLEIPPVNLRLFLKLWREEDPAFLSNTTAANSSALLPLTLCLILTSRWNQLLLCLRFICRGFAGVKRLSWDSWNMLQSCSGTLSSSSF